MVPPVPPDDEDAPLPAPRAEDLAVLEPPRSRRWWILAVVVVLVGALAGGWAMLGDEGTVYETEPVRRGLLTQKVTAVGQLEPLEDVEIGSDLTGRIAEVLVDENAHVAPGEVLARLDPTTFENAVTQRKAAYAAARANVEGARVELKRTEEALARTQRLHAQGATSAEALETAQLAVSAARAAVSASVASRDQAAAVLERAEQDLEDTVIRSPIDGVVIHRLVDPGQTVVSAMSATPLFEVASDLHQLQVEVDVDEADIGRVAAGQGVLFTVAAFPEQVFEARVMSVDLAADPSSSVVVYGTVLQVMNPDLVLRPGMTVTADITVGEIDDALLVPTIALRFRPPQVDPPHGAHVWTLKEGEPVAVAVRVGGSDGATTAVYGDDLAEGTPVIVGGGR